MPATTFTITREELSRVLWLQAQAYDTLLWLAQTSYARPALLNEQSADVLRDPTRCRQWVAEHFDRLPPRLQPTADGAEVFSRLFSSFFQTSFRIERRQVSYAPPHYVIAINRDEGTGKDKLSARAVPRHLRRKRAGEAQHLEYWALTLANDEPEDARFWMAAETVRADDTVRPDLLVWTYARELVHRSRGEAHGPAVHLIWKQMPKDVREGLTSNSVWDARGRVAEALCRERAKAWRV